MMTTSSMELWFHILMRVGDGHPSVVVRTAVFQADLVVEKSATPLHSDIYSFYVISLFMYMRR